MILSYLLSEYLSLSLFAVYSNWTGWRLLSGFSPNSITSAIHKISWAVLFCSAWWMLWELDRFFHLQNKKEDKQTERNEKERDNKNERAEERQRSESFKPEEGFEETYQEERDDSLTVFSEEDHANAKILGIQDLSTADFDLIKSTYRKQIAQYHPDKVLAMGPEIREVAEKKAKEINYAYRSLQFKFNQSS